MIHGQKGLKLPTGSSVVSSHGESIILPVNHQFGMPFIEWLSEERRYNPGMFVFIFLLNTGTYRFCWAIKAA